MKFLSLVLCLSIFFIALRFWKLGAIPEGFYSDEALYGYEAYSLLQTGRDQFGNVLPVSIAGFGDYRPALYIYATIPFIAFGLTEAAVRLPSAVSSLLSTIVVFYLVKNIWDNKRLALLSAFFFAISPWGLFFARMAHETNLMTLFIILGIWFLWKARNQVNFLLSAYFFFALAVYTYHTARLFVPIFIFYTHLLFRKNFYFQKKMIITYFAILTILLFPLINDYRNSASWARVRNINIISDVGTTLTINEQRGKIQSFGVPIFIARLLANKVTIIPLIFAKNYLTHFTLSFLITKGDPNDIYNTPYTGILLWVEPFLILIGLSFLWKKDVTLFWWLIGGILIGIVPDSLTKVAPSSARIHIILPFVSILSAYGMYRLNLYKKFLSFILVIITAFSFGWFSYNYLYTRPLVHASAWQIGTKDMIHKAQELSPQFNRIWISRSGWGWIHLLFHTQYNPEKFQQEAKVSTRNDVGFWWVSDVSKYHFDWLPASLASHISTLYIGTPYEFSENTKPLYTIRDKFGIERYWFVNGNSF